MSRVASRSSSRSRFVPAWWWSTGLGALLVVALLTVATGRGSPTAGAVEGSCQGRFTIDFAGLPDGTIIGEQYAGLGIHISGVANGAFPDALLVFDTNKQRSHDPDLHVNIGNIAIFPNNLTDNKPLPSGDGLVDDPDENNLGGTATFSFDQAVTIGSILWVDKDHSNPNFVVAYDAAGQVLVSVPVPQGANASVQRVDVNADGVSRLEFVYHESGGFTGIEVECAQPTPTPIATSTSQTPAPAASPTPIVAASAATPQAPAVLAAVSLPAGGGSPGTGGGFSWAAVLFASIVAGSAAFVLMRNAKR